MRDISPRPWHRWRVIRADSTPVPIPERHGRRVPTEAVPVRTAEPAGPDGIRHELVARIRQQIAAGTYDTEEIWLAAEEELLRRVASRV